MSCKFQYSSFVDQFLIKRSAPHLYYPKTYQLGSLLDILSLLTLFVVCVFRSFGSIDCLSFLILADRRNLDFRALSNNFS